MTHVVVLCKKRLLFVQNSLMYEYILILRIIQHKSSCKFRAAPSPSPRAASKPPPNPYLLFIKNELSVFVNLLNTQLSVYLYLLVYGEMVICVITNGSAI